MAALLPVIVITVLILVYISKDLTRHRELYGRGPWGWPFLAWGVVALLSNLVAALLYWSASHRQDKQRAVAPGPDAARL